MRDVLLAVAVTEARVERFFCEKDTRKASKESGLCGEPVTSEEAVHPSLLRCRPSHLCLCHSLLPSGL